MLGRHAVVVADTVTGPELRLPCTPAVTAGDED